MEVLKQTSPTRVPLAPNDSPSKIRPSSRARIARMLAQCAVEPRIFKQMWEGPLRPDLLGLFLVFVIVLVLVLGGWLEDRSRARAQARLRREQLVLGTPAGSRL